MKNTLLYLVLACLLLACQDKIELLREKRLREIETNLEKAWQSKSTQAYRNLIRKVGKEGNTPEGLTILKLATEVQQETKKILNQLSKKPHSSLLAYQKYMKGKLQAFAKPEELKNQPFFATSITHKKLPILAIENYFLEKIGATDMSFTIKCYFNAPIASMSLVGTYQAGQSYEAKLFCDTRKMDYEGDSVWVNGVFKKDKPFNISLPTLKAGKHTIHFKIKRLHKHIPEKDTTIFYTHHFTVLPK